MKRFSFVSPLLFVSQPTAAHASNCYVRVNGGSRFGTSSTPVLKGEKRPTSSRPLQDSPLLTIPLVHWSMQLTKLLSLTALVLVMLFLGTVSTEAANRYVRQGATGSGNGTDWTNAYATLPAALVRGDTYYIAAGTYPDYTFDDPPSGTTVITIKKATASDHGTDTGWQSSYGTGQAMFSGKIEFTTSNWVFDGVTGGGTENNWNQNFGFKITERGDSNAVIRVAYTGTANNITVRHVEMQGKGSVSTQGGFFSNDGLAVYNASNITISYFWMYGIGRCPFFLSGQNVIAEHGWVESYYGSAGVHSEVASIWSFDGNVGDTTFRYNLITDVQSTGGLMWDNSGNPSASMYVYGNIFYRIPGSRWDNSANGVIGGWTSARTSNIKVYNNTFINLDYMIFTTFAGSPSGNVAYNNLFYNTVSADYSIFQTNDYNHYINSGGTHGEGNGTSALSGDPFVEYTNFNFKLKGATAAGITLPSPFNLDPLGLSLGTVRGADGTWDRGAFEYSIGGTVTPAAPTALRIQ